MGNLSKNLSRKEFECQCGCGFDTADIELVNVLQNIIDYFESKYKQRIYCKISGGNRCVRHNETIQHKYNKTYIPYSSKSQHILARAVDFKLYVGKMISDNQISPDEVYDYIDIKYKGLYGVGWYNNRTHLDTRTNGPARWRK